MKTTWWMAITIIVLASHAWVDAAGDIDIVSDQKLSRTDLLHVLKGDMKSASFILSELRYDVLIEWLTQEEAHNHSRPLDIYIVEAQIGAFVFPIQNITPWSHTQLPALAKAVRGKVVDLLAERQIRNLQILAADEIKGIYMDEKMQNKPMQPTGDTRAGVLEEGEP